MSIERFEVVKELVFNKWYREWPIEITRGVLTKDNSNNELLLQLKFVNVGQKSITSISIDVSCYDEFNELVTDSSEKIKYIYQDINLNSNDIGGSREGIKLFNTNVRNVEVILNKVVFSDGEIKEYTNTDYVYKNELESIDILDDRVKSIAKAEFNKKNLKYKLEFMPKNTENGYWICGCGQYNEDKNDECVRCKVKKSELFELSSKEYCDKKVDKENKNKKRKKLIGGITLLSLIIIGIIVYFISGTFTNKQMEKSDYNHTFIAKAKYVAALKKDGSVVGAGNIPKGGVNGLCKEWTDIISISGNGGHIVGLKSNGTVVAEGNQGFELDEIVKWKNIIQVETGIDHTVGLKKDGTVVVTGFSKFKGVKKWKDVVKIYSDNYTIVGLKTNGTVLVAQRDNASELLNDKILTSELPKIVNWQDIKDIAVSDKCIIGLKNDGTVVALGNNEKGQCNINNWSNIKKVITSGWTTIGLKEDGTVIATGDNSDGDCNVTEWTDVREIYNTSFLGSTIGIKSDGSIVIAGESKSVDSYTILHENEKEWSNISKIAWGQCFIVGLKENGEVVIISYDDDSKNNGILEVNDWENIKSK